MNKTRKLLALNLALLMLVLTVPVSVNAEARAEFPSTSTPGIQGRVSERRQSAEYEFDRWDAPGNRPGRDAPGQGAIFAMSDSYEDGIAVFGNVPLSEGVDITDDFVDPVFLAIVRDIIGKPVGPILDSDVFFVNYLDLSYLTIEQTIYDLSGIEHFINLRHLFVGSQRLARLDVSKNTELIELSCWGNLLTELDVSNNVLLRYLDCGVNRLANLDVSKNTGLMELFCDSNYLTKLDVSSNTRLVELGCDSNQLTELDVSNNTALESLNCSYNQLTKLDVSNNAALEMLLCNNNQLSGTLDVSTLHSLRELNVSHNMLTGLMLSAYAPYWFIDASFNYMQDTSAITGRDNIKWDICWRFIFSPQNTIPVNIVTFVDWDGSELFAQEVEHGGTAMIPDDPVKAGHKFIGWYLGDELYDFDAPVTEDIILAAAYEAFPPITSIRIDLNAITRVPRNSATTVGINVNPGACPEEAATIVLTTSNHAMAIIGEDGRSVITQNRAGTVTVTATLPGTNLSHSVTLMIT